MDKAALIALINCCDLENISFAFLPFKELNEHCDALCKFGDDHTILQKIARRRASV